MDNCYLVCFVDPYGAEMKATGSLEDAESYALGYVKKEYMAEVSTLDELRRWELKQNEVQIKFFHVNMTRLDVLEVS